ncbi:MAG: ribosome biogenesis GTPase YlqF [Lachnospiraceae bacterium]|nr:ribosome biogenesis GTPase YlqF [Lachnospiraceae bacterium]
MAVYNWYPGHMAKAKRAMLEDIKLIDVIVELVDARAPFATRNPDIENLGREKERIIVLNKADLANDEVTDEWIAHFREDGLRAVSLNSKEKQGFKSVDRVIDEAASKKRERDLKRGIKNRPVRLMVAGIPNVGKSTFINSLCKKNIAKTGNKPGVTKGKQWISVKKGVDLMDTPGILWPRIDDPSSQLNLALIGSMNDEAINRDDLAGELISIMQKEAGDTLNDRYGVTASDTLEEALVKTATSLSMLRSGGEPDVLRARDHLITAFRSGELGRISLEQP